jgi:hypothetical protein
MRVICTATAGATTGEPVSTSPWLTVGREYVVLEIVARPGRDVLFRVATDQSGSPGLWDSRLFRTVATDMPASWSAALDDNGVVTIGPESWQRVGFWEAYFDGDPEAVRVYEDEMSDSVKTSDD